MTTTPQPQPEPTIADVMAKLSAMDSKLHLMDIETRTRDVELRLDMSTRFGDVMRLFEELAHLRSDYMAHGHPEPGE